MFLGERGLEQSASAETMMKLWAGSSAQGTGGVRIWWRRSLSHVQVFLFGAYKFPEKLTWIVGVFFC